MLHELSVERRISFVQTDQVDPSTWSDSLLHELSVERQFSFVQTGQVDTSTWSGKDGEKEGPLKTCYSKVFKSAIGLVIFLSWAATMQVSQIYQFKQVTSLFHYTWGLATINIAGNLDLATARPLTDLR